MYAVPQARIPWRRRAPPASTGHAGERRSACCPEPARPAGRAKSDTRTSGFHAGPDSATRLRRRSLRTKELGEIEFASQHRPAHESAPRGHVKCPAAPAHAGPEQAPDEDREREQVAKRDQPIGLRSEAEPALDGFQYRQPPVPPYSPPLRRAGQAGTGGRGWTRNARGDRSTGWSAPSALHVPTIRRRFRRARDGRPMQARSQPSRRAPAPPRRWRNHPQARRRIAPARRCGPASPGAWRSSPRNRGALYRTSRRRRRSAGTAR